MTYIFGILLQFLKIWHQQKRWVFFSITDPFGTHVGGLENNDVDDWEPSRESGELENAMLMIESLLEEVFLVERTREWWWEWLDHQEVFLVERTREWWWRVAWPPGSDTHRQLKSDDGSESTCQQKKISLVQPSLHELQLQFCFPANCHFYVW